VFHHRRAVFIPHLKQVGNVGRHRGFFVRRYPATSRRLVYFLPGLVALAMLPALAGLGLLLGAAPAATSTCVVLAWSALAVHVWKRAGWGALVFPLALACHHFWYGVSFLRGLVGRPVTS
jgi:hypothetical protein